MQIGDKATWTHRASRGRSVTLTTREGTIIDIRDGVATMRKKKGQEVVAVARLRAVEEKSELSEFVEAIVEANRK